MATKHGKPLRTLVATFLALAACIGVMAMAKAWTPKLGLDLRGGTTITLTATNTTGGGAPTRESLEQARTIIQQRVDSLGVGETEVTTSGERQIVVTVPNVQQDELVRLVGQTAVLTFRAVAMVDNAAPVPDPTATGTPQATGSPAPNATPGAEATPGAATPQAAPSGNPRPAPQLPTAPPAPKTPRPTAPGTGLTPEKALTWQPSEQDLAEFQEFTCDQKFVEVSDQPLIACDRSGTQKLLLGPALVKGDMLTNATAGVPQNQLNWVVNLEFNNEGAAAFEKATGQLASQQDPMNRFAIVLDGKSISAPSVSQAIPGGRAEISGGFDEKSATELANVLKYGALPLAFEVSSVDNVSATLGGEQLRAGIIAGLIGLGLVVLYSFLYYRGLGIVVVASLAVAAAFTYAMMVLLGKSVGFALNLPGIAGAIVAIGTTADSFIIYFERIRDEVRDGRSLRSAVETGWQKARSTILVADAVSLLSAVVLFILAIGAVKGFAFTLGLTTLIDIAMVFWFTKPLMSLLVRTKFFGQGHKLSGLDAEHFGVKSIQGRTGRRTTRPTIEESKA
ncbi:protein translocase subunit SecD [Mariniluteicoccus endophyticus]